MDQDTYVVFETDRGWTLTLNDGVLAHGVERERAEQAAEIAARTSRERGRSTEIVIYDGRKETPFWLDRIAAFGAAVPLVLPQFITALEMLSQVNLVT